jgi:hypothetical protein
MSLFGVTSVFETADFIFNCFDYFSSFSYFIVYFGYFGYLLSLASLFNLGGALNTAVWAVELKVLTAGS